MDAADAADADGAADADDATNADDAADAPDDAPSDVGMGDAPADSTATDGGGSADAPIDVSVDGNPTDATTSDAAPSDAASDASDASVMDAPADADDASIDGTVGDAGAGDSQVCGPVVDQYNMVNLGWYSPLINTPVEMYFPGQSFTAGISGLLTGVEVSLGSQAETPTSDQIHLEIFDTANNSLGKVSRSTAIAGVQPSFVTNTTAQGPGYFDVTALGIHVTAGTKYRFEVSIDLSTCELSSATCSGNGETCIDDFQCDQSLTVGFEEQAPTDLLNRYLGGDAYMNGILDTSSYWEDLDHNFKTIVLPATCFSG